MKDLLDLINDADLAGRVRTVLSFLDHADACFLGLVVAVLAFVGSKLVAGQPRLRGWGLRLAVTAFLAYGGYACYRAGSIEGPHLPATALRAALIGGLVLAAAWILLPVAAFAYRYFRLAVAAFLAYGGYALATAQGFHSDQLPDIALRGLAAAGLVMVVAWILQPIYDYLTQTLGLRPANQEQATAAVPERARFRRGRKRRLPPAAAPALPGPEEPVRLSVEAQRRRERARMKAELCYALARPDIGDRLPRPTFDEFVGRYLGDHLPPEEVEENSRLLQMLLRAHQEYSCGPRQFATLEDLTFWYLQEQKRIQQVASDSRTRQGELLHLYEEYLTLADRFLEERSPA